MSVIGEIEVQLDLDGNKFTGQIRLATESLKNFGRVAETQTGQLVRMERQLKSTNDTLNDLKKTAMAFVGIDLVGRGLGQLIDAQKTMQQIHFGLVSATGSEAAAGEAFEWVSAKAKELGVNLQHTAAEYTKLTASATALGVPLEQQRAVFEGLSKSGTVLHLSTDQMKYATMALTQMFSKGKIQAEELRRQLGEQIPGVVPRFQRAAMAIAEKSGHAGKSFDDLLRAGALTTDKYLPAMIEALEETSRGWELASHSMQAELNRLSNAWLKFRADTSGGIFSDAVIGGAKLLGENMKLIATSIMAMGAAYGAAQLGKLGKDIAARIQGYAAEQKSMIAGQVARNEVHQRRLAQGRQTQAQLTQERAQVQAITTAYQQQLATLDARRAKIATNLANSFGATDRGAAGRTRINQNRLVAIDRERAATRAALSAQQRLAAGIETQLAAATSRVAAAEAVATTTTRARMAATIASMRATAAAAGSSLAALAGGPIGIALIAIGALGMAFYDLKAKAEAAAEKHKQLTEELKLSGLTLNDTVDQLRAGGLSLADAFNKAAEQAKLLKESKTALSEARAEYQRLLDLPALAKIDLVYDGESWKTYGERLAAVKQKIDDLEPSVQKAEQAMKNFEAVIRASLPPDLAEQAIQSLRNVDNVTFDVVRDRIAQFGGEARREFADIAAAAMDLMRKLQNNQVDWRFKIGGATKGKDWETAARFAHSQIVLGRDMSTPEAQVQLQQIVAQERANMRLEASFKKIGESRKAERKASTAAAREAKKAETEAENAAKKREQTIDSQFASLQQLNYANQEALKLSERMTPAQLAIAKAEFALEHANIKLTGARKASFEAEKAQLLQSEQLRMAHEREIKNKERMIQLERELADTLAEAKRNYDSELSQFGMGSRQKEEQGRIDAIFNEFAAKEKEINSQNWTNNDQARLNEIDKWRQHFDQRLDMERDFQRKRRDAEGDWRNGFKAALADYQSSAANTSQQIYDVTSFALEGMGNAWEEFCITGKANFREFAASILKMILKIIIMKMIAGLLGGNTNTGSVGGGGYSFGSTSMGFGTGLYQGGQLNAPTIWPNANGGIMTQFGSMPLKKYANGGIANSPQLALFGEGKMPEAYVPLPDGRSIPVTIKGGMPGGSGGEVVNNINITVAIDQNGNQKERSAVNSDEQGRALGKMIDGRIRETIADEMRPGGSLWRMKHG